VRSFRGTISGLVSDPSGSPVAAARATATEAHTGRRLETVSNSGGQYTVPFVEPGDYDIDVVAQGFKHFARKAVHVGAGDHAVIDIPLQLGDAQQTVSVTADAPILNSENSSIGQAITETEVQNLPLNGRTPLTLAALSMGVLATGQPGLIHPFDLGGAAGWSVGGCPRK
jgi:Carboxypeptidase regulatory-like domain